MPGLTHWQQLLEEYTDHLHPQSHWTTHHATTLPVHSVITELQRQAV